MSDTLGLADNRCKNLLERYNNPLLTLFHRVKVDTSSAYKLEIIADNLGTQENYCVLSGLPLKKRPDFKDNRSKIVYLYRLQINSTVSPFFNLSGIPFIGQTPILGAPSKLSFVAQAPVGNLEALNHSPVQLSKEVMQK